MNQVGDLLRQQGKQFSVKRDTRSGAWHILNLWHESLASLMPDSDVPLDSLALTVLPADAFNALIEEANRLGVLARLIGPNQPAAVKLAEMPTSAEGSSKEYYKHQLSMQALENIRQITVSSNLQSVID